MDRNFSEQYFSANNNNSAQVNPSKLQEARLRKAMQTRLQSTLQLSNVIGLSSTNKHSIQFNPITGDCYYIAGSIIVVYNIDSNSQQRYIFSPNKRSITTICISPNGRYLAAGEGTCKNPEIIIWDLQTLTSDSSDKPIKQLRGHKYGLKMIFFSPNLNYLISIGDENDKGLLVWDWQSELRLTQNKLSKIPLSACFASDGTKFVSCGEKHVKFWQFQPNGDIIRTPVKDKEDAFILEGKSVTLGSKFQDKTFSDCCFDYDSKMLYAATTTGQLSIIDDNRILNKWMDLKVPRIFSISLSRNEIICACADSYIRVFKALTLDHIVTLPKTPALLNYNIEKGVTKAKPVANKGEYADVIGLIHDEERKRIAAIYSDRSLFIWDISSLDKVTMKRSFISHSGRINDLQIIKPLSSADVTFFVTTSIDKTVRIWHEVNEDTNKTDSPSSSAIGLRRNVYSKHLSRILYMTQDPASFKYKEPISSDDDMYKIESVNENTEHPICVRCTQDGSRLIVGSSYGRLSVINTSNFEVEYETQAHEQEISALDVIETANQRFVATGSRDRQIKIFDLNALNYKVVSLFDDHNSMIVSVKLASIMDSIYLISASSDRQIIFREFKNSLEGFKIIHREVEKVSKINSLELTSDHSQLIVGFDKKISTFSVATGKLIQSNETKEDDSAASKAYLDNIALAVDESASYVASFNSDKVMRVRECGALMGVLSKVSCGDTITAVAFTYNSSHLITASVEGCIYMWGMHADHKKNIERKRQQLGIVQKSVLDVVSSGDIKNIESFWIEEEVRSYLSKQKSVVGGGGGGGIAAKSDYSIEQILGNLRPVDLMKNTNLPNWAKSKPVNLNQMYVQKQDESVTNASEKPSKPIPNNKKLEDERPPLVVPQQQQQQQLPPARAAGSIPLVQGGKSGFIEDSLNMRVSNNIQSNLPKFSSNFGYDSINERDDDDGIFGSKNVASIMGNFQGNAQKGVNQFLEAKKVISDDGAKQKQINLQDDDEDDEVNLHQDKISAFLTRDGFRGDLAVSGVAQQQNDQNEMLLEKSIVGDLVASQHVQLNQNNAKVEMTETVVEDIEDIPENPKKDDNSLHITYKKSNGLASVFDPQHIQGQLKQVEQNMKQIGNNYQNIFESKQINAVDDDNQIDEDILVIDGSDDLIVVDDDHRKVPEKTETHQTKGKFDTFAQQEGRSDKGNPVGLVQMQNVILQAKANGSSANTKIETGQFPVLDVIQERNAIVSKQEVGNALKIDESRQQLQHLGEQNEEEMDESYLVVQKKEYQLYQQQIDSSFKVILEHLSMIEDIVENQLDAEPLALSKKVHEKIALKSNKVKAILQNIAFKHSQVNPTSANISIHLENDRANKELIENYSRMLMQAMLNKK